ncbi:MAG TPA: riboflavin synthase [Actinomycetota bacterium]|nr:riboflavin synthase [Actinomycetota bacterium]
MFTGIVEDLGFVDPSAGGRLVVRASASARDAEVGDSIAVNGTCLTVVEVGEGTLAFDVSAETIARTALGRLRPDARVNLERPLTLLARLGGHLVQGHVDGVGELVARRPEAGGGARIVVRLPRELLRFVVEKGSIALDGVSLTVAAIEDDRVDVALIPHTLAVTTFGESEVGDPLNVEVDVVGKYVMNAVERLLADRVARAEEPRAVADGPGR